MTTLIALFEERTLPGQMAWVTGAAAAIAAAVTWFGTDGQGALALAALGGALAAAVAATLLTRRVANALHGVAGEARQLRRDDGPGAANFTLRAGSAESSRATLALRQLVETLRERIALLEARNVALGRRLDRRTHELSTLQDLSIGLTVRTDLNELVDEALGALEQTIDYASASIWARETRTRIRQVVLLGYRCTFPLGAAGASGLRGMRLSRANLQRYEQIERERAPIIENRAHQGLLSWLWTKVTDDAPSSGLYRTTRAWMAVPLKFRDDVLGVLRVDQEEEEYFTAERARLLTAVASQTALAMRHAQLLAREREVAVVAERSRIARELHDAVSQTLFAASVVAGTLARVAGEELAGAGDAAAGDSAPSAPPSRAAILSWARTLERLNRAALAEMRLLMFELRPDALDQVPLAELLQRALEALACRTELTIEQHLASGADTLDPATRVQLYRIAQEALSNLMRHSGAQHAVVEWRHAAPRSALLRIADDGQGFDPEQPRAGHFGLDNMRSRAAEIGASFTLTSNPGQGTEVRVEIGSGP